MNMTRNLKLGQHPTETMKCLCSLDFFQALVVVPDTPTTLRTIHSVHIRVVDIKGVCCLVIR